MLFLRNHPLCFHASVLFHYSSPNSFETVSLNDPDLGRQPASPSDPPASALHNSMVTGGYMPMQAFSMGTGESNSGPRASTANTLSHWTTSFVPGLFLQAGSLTETWALQIGLSCLSSYP